MTDKVSLSTTEAANLLSISRAKLYELIQTGQLTSFHIGSRRLISRHALDDYVEKREAASQAA